MSAHISNLRKFAFAVLTAAMAAACTEDLGLGTPENQPAGPVLSLTTGSSFGTRSDDHDNIKDEDEYAEAGEEVIRRVDLFFFDGKDDKNAPFHACEVTVDAKTTADLTVKVPQNLEEKFTNATYVYALVNLPATVKVDATAKTIDGKSATLENLQQVWVTEEGFVEAGTPKTFVMRGGNVENIEVSKGSDGVLHVSGTILLERLASKIRLWANIPNEIYLDENGKTLETAEGATETWELYKKDGKADVKLYLYNLTKKGRIDGYLGSEGDTDPVDLGYDNVDRRKARENAVRHLVTDASLNEADKDGTYTYSHVPAYYSYPNKWDGNNLNEQHQTYVIVSVVWKKSDASGDEFQTCYYQVPVNALKAGNIDANQLAPNHYYRIKVHIGMLGSKDLGNPTPLDASYEVVDWVTNDVDVTIKDRRYLVVNQKEWVMNNVHTLQIPFHTSHRTEVVACYVNYFRYNDVWGTEQESKSVFYNTNGYYQDIQGAPQYNKEEFSVWKNAGGDTEQLLENISFDGTDGNELYYKPKYFTGDFYVGREHPITFKRNKVKCPESLSDAEKAAWNLYNEKYDNINAVYTCTIDPEKNVINFNHPLIAWEKKQKTDGEEYYVPIINTRTDGLWDEYSRCEIIIKIKHEDWKKDDHLFEETIYITQYPGMYVEESHNYGNIANTYEIRNIFGNVTRKKYYGGNEYVRVNGETTYNYNDAINSNQDYEIGIYGAFGVTNSLIQYDARTNMNPNMYVIHITQLSADDKEHQYEIGDPRSLTSNINLSDNSFNSSPPTDDPAVGWPRTSLYDNTYPNSVSKALYGGPNNNSNGADKWNNGQLQGKGTLTYYYPTDETNGAGSKENFVAPVIRVASSFGKIQSLVKSEARRRCAAYQEAGRPAGRWRLPTKGEVKYIAALSRDGIIPVLFGVVGDAPYAYYWTATGVIGIDKKAEIFDQNVPNNTSSIVTSEGKSTISVRCVYDDWYWIKDDGTEDVVTPEISNTDGKPADEYWGRVSDFYWGDKKKDNTQAQSIIRRLTKSK